MSDWFDGLSFARPWVLLALIVPVALALWELTRRGVRVRVPFDYRPAAATHPLRRKLLGGLIVVANALPAVALGAAVVLLAGPRVGVQGDREKQMANIQFCLDISGSMAAPFGNATRYDAAMQAVNDFADYRDGDAFGLTIFGNDVLHWVPLTPDTDALKRSTDFVRPGRMPPQFGGTSIAFGLRQCLALLEQRAEGERLIVLVSDGMSGDIQGALAGEVGQELREASVIVYPIHIGGGDVPAPLHTIAGVTGGQAFSAGDPASLAAVFGQIDQMQPSTLKPPGRAYEDRPRLPALVALSAAALHGLTLLGLRFTPF